MKNGLSLFFVPGVLMVGVLAAVPARGDFLTAEPTGFNEVPNALVTPASAQFHARINGNDTEIHYELTYSGFNTPVTQAHLHFGKRGVNGGVIAFLCSNLNNGPMGTPACPSHAGTVTGTLTAASVVGPAAQGIVVGEFHKLLSAIRADAVYANVHSQGFPAGELRDQLQDRRPNN